jgi:hypothetical protein
MNLATSGFPKLRPPAATAKESQIQIINRLAAKEFMDTVGKRGTNPPRLMAGVKRFVEQAGYRVSRLEQQGCRDQSKRFPARVTTPSLAWIQHGLAAPGGVVWLNVGWYARRTGAGEYQRIGGHWVTLVGYEEDRRTPGSTPVFLIHDPAPRTGKNPLTQRVKLARLDHGWLVNRLSSGQLRRCAATGFFTLNDGMKLKSGADTAMIDAAVVMVVR